MHAPHMSAIVPSFAPTDPVGRLLFNVMAMVAEFETDLIPARRREGMAVDKAKVRLRRKQPKLSKPQEAQLLSVHRAGTHTTVELAELFRIVRSTFYRAIKRSGEAAYSTVPNLLARLPCVAWNRRLSHKLLLYAVGCGHETVHTRLHYTRKHKDPSAVVFEN